MFAFIDLKKKSVVKRSINTITQKVRVQSMITPSLMCMHVHTHTHIYISDFLLTRSSVDVAETGLHHLAVTATEAQR